MITVVVLVCLAPAAASAVTVGTGGDLYDGEVPASVPTASGYTVVTADGAGPGIVAAYAPNGTKVYDDRRFRYYHDVDPAPEFGRTTVAYVASRVVDARHCRGEDVCHESMVVRANLTTGERETVWSRYTDSSGSVNVHDVDFVNETHLLVADIAHPDGVYVVDVSSGETAWRWNASEHYDRASDGGQYPGDWTHLNDVEYLPERGLVMASPRNMDSVVFLRPGEGVVEELTLGSDEDHETLYEQHNPDYLPAERGGPAVVVADSENDRVVEYQRRGRAWERTWLWTDGDVEWPRDVDRLPNDHTLVTDTHSNRVIEVDAEGDVVWTIRFPGPYEAERLATGAESAGGYSADSVGIESRSANGFADAGVAGSAVVAAEFVLPNPLLNGTLFVLPAWMTPIDAVGVVYAAIVLAFWLFGEIGHAARRRYLSRAGATDSEEATTTGGE